MGRIKPPADIIAKRDTLHGGDTSRDSLVEYGDHYLETGAVHDALSFYLRAEHEPGIRKVLDLGQSEGEAFLLQRIERSHKISISTDAWRRTAESAEERGKLRYALTAYERCGDEARANAIRAKLGIAEVHRVLPGTELVDPATSSK
jgi:hypothetical protein